MDGTLHPVQIPDIAPDRREILRYAMLPSCAEIPEDLPLEECLHLCEGKIHCRAVWKTFPLSFSDSGLDLGFASVSSAALRRHLDGCDALILFACTAGFETDRLIARCGARSPAHGLVMHAIGAQQVEGACDWLCARLAEAFPDRTLTSRFSPGYEDLPLDLQRKVMPALSCEKTVGITLNDSLLMQPSKSVTAVIGMKRCSNVPD